MWVQGAQGTTQGTHLLSCFIFLSAQTILDAAAAAAMVVKVVAAAAQVSVDGGAASGTQEEVR